MCDKKLRDYLIELYDRSIALNIKCIYDIYEYSYASEKDELHLICIEKGHKIGTTIHILDIFDVIDSNATDNYDIKILYLGSRVKRIMDSAFSSQHSLYEVYIKDSENKLEICANSFSNCNNLNTFYCTRISILGSCAFQNCYNLRNINLDTVEYIGIYCFDNNIELENISLTSVKVLKENSFKGCIHLEHIYIGEYLESLKYPVFNDCNRLIRVVIDSNCKEFSFYAFPCICFVLYLKYYNEILSRATGYIPTIDIIDKSLLE